MNKISWHALEYIHTEKTTDWYWIVGIVSVSIALIAIILNNVIFGVLIIVGTFTLTLYASRPPEYVEIEINKTGVRVGNKMHPYPHLESFWVETRERHARIILKSTKKIVPHIVILIEDVDPEDVKEVLNLYLPEIEQSEPFFEKLLLYLGF